ncbi:hypothetical protein P4B35_21285 [Pontiellaceae bacterium B12227]|nr:hypothetical protein [Pontiellaceae bacterium B12227]
MIKQLSLILLIAAVTGCQQGPGGRQQGGRGGPQDASAEDFVARLDKDGDGRVSAKEFDGPDEHFTQADQNGDGYISEDEAPDGPPDGGGRRR